MSLGPVFFAIGILFVWASYSLSARSHEASEAEERSAAFDQRSKTVLRLIGRALGVGGAEVRRGELPGKTELSG